MIRRWLYLTWRALRPWTWKRDRIGDRIEFLEAPKGALDWARFVRETEREILREMSIR